MSARHQDDAAQRARLRWRARRGLLENDLILQRFLGRHESSLTDRQVTGLHELLDLPDNELLDLILRTPGRRDASADTAISACAREVLELIESA